jgi:hypothetical protein
MAERVVSLEVDWTPDPGAPAPLLVQNEDRAALIFEGARLGGPVLVEFGGCFLTRFGYPNDEALAGHQLYSRGLRSHGAFEVMDSSWLVETSARNAVRFPTAKLPRLRHFVITFHDSTFECLAEAIDGRALGESLDSALERYLTRPT